MKALWPAAALLLALTGCGKGETLVLRDHDPSYAPCTIPVGKDWKIATKEEQKTRDAIFMGKAPMLLHSKQDWAVYPSIGTSDQEVNEMVAMASHPAADLTEKQTIAGHEVTVIEMKTPSRPLIVATFKLGKHTGLFSAYGDDASKDKLVAYLNETLPKIKCE